MEQSAANNGNAKQPEKYIFEKRFELVTVEPDEAINFLHEINIYNERYSEGDWIFRGQNNANWTLIPSIFRDKKILCMAKQELEKYIEKYPNESMSEELRNRDNTYNFILARICAAVEHDRVNSFVIRLDNADIGIPNHSNFHQPDYSPEYSFDFLQVDVASRVAQRSNFRRDWLRREVREIVSKYSNLPHADQLSREEMAHASYEYLEQRFFDISFAIAQHSGLPTGLLDWTTNPLVAAFYAAYTRAKKCPDYDRLVVWALEPSLIENNILGTRLIEHPKSYVTNIHAQSAAFTRDANDWRDYVIYDQEPHFEKYLGLLVDSGGVNHRIWRITLPFRKRHELLILLKRSNISLSTLEPTHYHVASDVMEEFHQRQSDAAQ